MPHGIPKVDLVSLAEESFALGVELITDYLPVISRLTQPGATDKRQLFAGMLTALAGVTHAQIGPVALIEILDQIDSCSARIETPKLPEVH